MSLHLLNTRVTDILRDEDVLPLYRKAGLIHVSLGTEAAAQLKLDRFDPKRTRVAESGTDWKAKHSRKIKGDVQARIMACGGGKEQLDQAEIDALTVAPTTLPKASVKVMIE